jgi:DNA-binding GntR family transcriptional regulator
MKLEVFEDRMYFDQWCVRPKGSSDFNDTIHFIRKEEALVARRVIEGWVEQEREACAQIVEALKEIVDAADGTGWDQLDATFTRARAALKKARGER